MGKFSKIKKYSKPSLTINEKIQELNKELEKTGMLSERMTTDALYQQGEYVPERGTDHTSNFEDAPEYISGGSKLLSTQSFTSNEFATIRRQFPSYTSRAGWKWIYISNIFRADWGNNINSFGETGGIGGYYTSMPDARLIAGGSVIRTSDPVVGYTTRYHPNNYPATAPLRADLDDPDYLPVLDRNNKNKKRGPKDPWEELKKRLKAGKDYEDEQDRRRRRARRRQFEEEGEENAPLDPLEVLAKLFLKVANSLPFIKLYSKARIQLMDYSKWLRNPNSRPNPTPIDTQQKRWWVSRVDERLKQFYNKDGTAIGFYDDPGLTKDNIARAFNDVLVNDKPAGLPSDIYMVHGQLRPGWNPKGSTSYGFSSDGRGGINIIDGYDFHGKGDVNAGAPGIAGTLLPLIARAATSAEREILDKELNNLPTMKQVTNISASDLRGSLLEKILLKQNINEDHKPIKGVSLATKDPSPILEKKILQTERKSPSRFLAKEKREDTSRARWLKKS